MLRLFKASVKKQKNAQFFRPPKRRKERVEAFLEKRDSTTQVLIFQMFQTIRKSKELGLDSALVIVRRTQV